MRGERLSGWSRLTTSQPIILPHRCFTQTRFDNPRIPGTLDSKATRFPEAKREEALKPARQFGVIFEDRWRPPFCMKSSMGIYIGRDGLSYRRD